MIDSNQYPHPPSHRIFDLGSVTLDSDFDSGNLYSAEKVNHNTFNLWIAVDHPKNQYRTWFHFSLKGLHKGTVAAFNIKNMQNQSKLLNEGLVPVYREESSKEWKRVAHKIDLSKIEYNEGWIEWSFKHTMTSDQKVFLAFFYPWSNTENDLFLRQTEEKCRRQPNLYFQRSSIIRSLEGRPVDFITISSKKWISSRNQRLEDEHLFASGGEPKQFGLEKKCIIISARVHPGEVPSSHVMTGIISELTQDSEKGRLLRDKFVFYLFPILNPDGVSRGHYRVDPNGINLNRCYINPSPKTHSPIYAIKKVITHFHSKGKYFGFLDLHAHAARKGVFIYGNSANELDKQVEICLFPKILSMNSEIFEYEGSNFTEQNMYCKDINDHVSKEGAGRVALFKATKNPYSWTLECNYNTSRVINKLQDPRKPEEALVRPNQKQLDSDLIINYKYPTFKQPKEFYTIQHFRRLGKQICESFLDLVELNPQSRIDSPRSHFKSVQNLKMNLAVALLRMAPNRFEPPFKKIYHCIEGPSATKQLSERAVKALYYLLIKKAKIENMGAFLKDGDESSVIIPIEKTRSKKGSLSQVRELNSPLRNPRLAKSNGIQIQLTKRQSSDQSKMQLLFGKEPIQFQNQQTNSPLRLTKVDHDFNKLLRLEHDYKPAKQEKDYKLDSDDSEGEDPNNNLQLIPNVIVFNSEEAERMQAAKISNVLNSQLLQVNFNSGYQRILGKKSEIAFENLRVYRKSFNSQSKKFSNLNVEHKRTNTKIGVKDKELPSIMTSKIKAMVSISSLANDLKLKKGSSAKEPTIFYVQSE